MRTLSTYSASPLGDFLLRGLRGGAEALASRLSALVSRDGDNFSTIFTLLMYSLTHNSVQIDSKSLRDKLNIKPNCLANDYDIRAVVEGAKFACKFTETMPL